MKTRFAKITFTCLLVTITMLVNSNTSIAQPDNSPSAQPDQQNQLIARNDQLSFQKNKFLEQNNSQYVQRKQHGDQHKNIEAQRIAFITQELNLTPDEAKVFWPVYNEYDVKRHELRKSFKNAGDFKKQDIDKLSEKEINQILDNQIIEAQKFLDLRKEYHAKFKSVLPAVKVLKLYNAEREFQRMLMDRMGKQKPLPPPGKK